MKICSKPKTKPGWWSVGLIIAMPVLFFLGMSFTNSLYKTVPAGRTIAEDIMLRPVLALTMLFGMSAGVAAFVFGIIAITRKKERAITVYFSTTIGFLLLLFLVAEVLFPH